MTVGGEKTTVGAVLADPVRCALLSDEGPIANPRDGRRAVEETMEEIAFEGGVRCVVNSPGQIDPAKATRLVLYAAPAGSSIGQTIGRRVESKVDWLFDVQHIGAQARWLRAHRREVNRVVAEVQAEPKSFVRWKHVHPDHPARVGRWSGRCGRNFQAQRWC